MRNIALAALLVLAVPGSSTALTIPLIHPSTLSGTVDHELFGPGVINGYSRATSRRTARCR